MVIDMVVKSGRSELWLIFGVMMVRLDVCVVDMSVVALPKC